MKKVIVLTVRVIGYLAAMGLSVLFALYLSAPAGWTFFYILAAAPVFSFIITALTVLLKSLEINADINSSMVYKNEVLLLKISVKNRSFFPVPALVLKIRGGEGFVPERKEMLYIVSVSPRSAANVEIAFKAVMWGEEKIGIESAHLSDFLHFIKIPLYKEKGEGKYFSSVKVFPDIPDVPSDMPLIKTAAETLRYAEETEDTKEADIFNLFGGSPGYTHREYQDGDPIKRINWKLSSKKDVYMVRLDDEIESMQQVIVLDSRGSSRQSNERAVEGVLAVAFSLFRLGFGATVWYSTKEGFISSEISDYGDVTSLQTALAGYSFTSDKNAVRIPLSELAEKKQSGGIMLFTPLADHSLSAAAEEAQRSGTAVTAVIAGEVMTVPAPYWVINSDYTAELIS